MAEIKWCCEPFKELHENYGKRGFGGLLSTDYGVIRFITQFRAAEKGLESQVRAPDSIIVMTIGETVMSFCPYCGVNLKKYYSKQMELFPKREAIPL